jgi:hypothetical protein
MEEHVYRLRGVNGKRLCIFNRLKISFGWAVSTKVPEGFWEKCKVMAIPMEPLHILGLFPNTAVMEMNSWVSKYGKDILVVLIPDGETKEGYSGGPVLLSDLEKEPGLLLRESSECIKSDVPLSNMKRRAAMMLFGWDSTN